MSIDGRPPQAPDAAPSPAVLDRRGLLGSGALLAGAAGVAALVLSPPATASAADGDTLELGADNEATSTTGLGIGVPTGTTSPTLALYNAGGPTLSLQPLAADFAGAMELGEIANTELGPIIGVDSELGLTTTFLATGIDLADLPTPFPLPVSVRLLDTRTTAGRARVLRSSQNPWDSSFRLKAGGWIDVEAVPVTGEFETPGAWVNLTAVAPTKRGHASIYRPGPLPGTSTLNFQKGVTIANSAFVATDIVAGRYAVRIRTSVTTHLVLDLTGLSIKGAAPTPDANSNRGTTPARSSRSALTRRLRSNLTRRLRTSLSR